MQDEFGKIVIGCEFYLAIVDTNSIILYYQCSNTLKDLDSISTKSGKSNFSV